MNIKQRRMGSTEGSRLNQTAPEKPIKQAKMHINNDTRQNLQTVLVVKSKQFKFDCGVIMANIRTKENNPSCLFYYAQKATDSDNFVELVRNAIIITGGKLTSGDEARLKKEYSKYNRN